MTQPVQTISYASPNAGNCPLCLKRPVTAKTIYAHPVCKKCFYAFANRRQLGYLVDAIIITAVNIGVTLLVAGLLPHSGSSALMTQTVLFVIMAGITLIYIMKDGFNGGSPGTKLTNIQVLDDRTGRPIGFGQSFKRNAILLFGLIPILGGLVSLVIIIVIAVQVAKGYRLGDRFAQTRAIWKKYAHLPVFGGDALVCEQCGYDLRGNMSGACPECGAAVSEKNRQRLALAPAV